MSYGFKHPVLFVIVCCLGALLTGAIVTATTIAIMVRPPSPAPLFRKLVVDPMPESVNNIRADGFGLPGDHHCVLRFDISEADLSLILDSRPFKEISYVRYSEGGLSYGERSNSTTSPGLYPLGYPFGEKPAPGWFRLGEWDSFKAYIFEEKGTSTYRVRLLVYNHSVGQAYFIDVEIRGTGIETFGSRPVL